MHIYPIDPNLVSQYLRPNFHPNYIYEQLCYISEISIDNLKLILKE